MYYLHSLATQNVFLCGSFQQTTDVKVVVFVTYGSGGSAKLRGELLAQALNAEVSTSLADIKPWSAFQIPALELNVKIPKRVDVCIVVKSTRNTHALKKLDAVETCRDHGAITLYDVIDNEPMLALLENVTPDQNLPLNFDFVLTQSKRLAFKLGTYRAAVLYHHHSNPGIRTSPNYVRGHVRRIGFLAGHPKNALTEREYVLLDEALRRAAPDSSHLSFAVILQNASLNGSPQTAVVRGPEQHQECRMRRSGHKMMQYDDTGQVLYHNSRLITCTDMAVVWPADRYRIIEKPTTTERPLTRFIFWLSHGVPTIAYNYTAYREVINDHDYRLIGDSAPSLVVDSIDELEHSAKLIMASAEARVRLRAKGLQIARRFTIDKSAIRLLEILTMVLSRFPKATTVLSELQCK